MYTKEYFIKKFESIKSEDIGQGSLSANCALAHCGVKNWVETEEADALADLFGAIYKGDYSVVFDVNDGNGIYRNSGETPKDKILNRLRSL